MGAVEFLGGTDACACAINRCVLKSQLLNWLARAGSLALEAVRCVFRIDDWFAKLVCAHSKDPSDPQGCGACSKAGKRLCIIEQCPRRVDALPSSRHFVTVKGVVSREPTQTIVTLLEKDLRAHPAT